MKHWFGLAFALGGAWLLWAGLMHRARVLAVRSRLDAPEESEGRLTAFGEILRPIVIAGVVVFGAKATLVYAMVDDGAVFSWTDLAGLWLLLASYAAWLVLKTSHRMPHAAARASLQAGEPVTVSPEGSSDHGPELARPRGTAARPGPAARPRHPGGGVAEAGEAA